MLIYETSVVADLYNGISDGTTTDVLYAGDTINPVPATVTSVGDESGEVYDNNPGLHLPP